MNCFHAKKSYVILGGLIGCLLLVLPGCGLLPGNFSQPVSSLEQTSTQPVSSPPSGEADPVPDMTGTPSTPMIPSPSPSNTSTAPVDTQVILTPLPTLPVVQGTLDSLIVQLEADAPRQGSHDFIQPNESDLNDFKRIVEELFSGNFSAASTLASRYDYELAGFQDQELPEVEFIMLREQRPVQRGWGLYVIRLDTCRMGSRSIIVEAPHILADESTPQIAVDTFRALNACALMIAGAHRSANSGDTADVAHNPNTVFNSVQSAIAGAAGPSALVLQIHGFAAGKHPGYPSIVIGNTSPGDSAAGDLLVSLREALSAQGISVGLCDDTHWTSLCGETNVLASSLQEGLFVHLELDESVRSNPNLLISTLVEILLKPS